MHNSAFCQLRTPAENAIVQVKFLKSFPNPATSAINFEFVKGYQNNYNFIIFNFIGKPIFESKNIPSRVNVNLDNFYRGIYVYQLRTNNGAILESGKFQVIK